MGPLAGAFHTRGRFRLLLELVMNPVALFQAVIRPQAGTNRICHQELINQREGQRMSQEVCMFVI